MCFEITYSAYLHGDLHHNTRNALNTASLGRIAMDQGGGITNRAATGTFRSCFRAPMETRRSADGGERYLARPEGTLEHFSIEKRRVRFLAVALLCFVLLDRTKSLGPISLKRAESSTAMMEGVTGIRLYNIFTGANKGLQEGLTRGAPTSPRTST